MQQATGHSFLRYCMLAFLTGWQCLAVAGQQQLLAEAQHYLTQQRPTQAYTLLAGRMADYAGDSHYDYLLGRAALQSGKANLAVFALERVAASQPQALDSRLLLAKAYYKVGEYAQARQHAHYVSRHADDSLQQQSQQLLAQLRPRQQGGQNPVWAILSLGAGSDSNANSAPDLDTFLGTTLSDTSKTQPSPVTQASISFGTQLPLGRKLRSRLMTHVLQQDYTRADFVNTRLAQVNASLDYQTTRHIQHGLNLRHSYVEVDDKLNHQQTAVSLKHRQTLAPSHAIGVSLSSARLDYQKQFDIRDIQQNSIELRYDFLAHSSKKEPLHLYTSLRRGQDQPRLSDSFYGRDFNAARVGLQLSNRSRKVRLSADLSYMQSDYDGLFFGQTREDSYRRAAMSLRVKLAKKWFLTPDWSVGINHSNVDVYDYRRTQTKLTLSHVLT